ncbi:fascin-like isoform X5 [Narcine bancroftii]|uniref:fascin-like isoform X5 n=1 Tax=Narcine bancroftii TaxID=1343680 RepID=UPI0038322BBE
MVYRVLPAGLINSAQKYLTAENFNFKVHATSSTLNIKQIWTIEFLKENSPLVQIRSSLRRYLAGDNNGKITCDWEVPNPYNKFQMIMHPDGKVSFQSEETKRYLGGAEDNIMCFAQVITESEKWVVHLAIHPNINLFNQGKKKYLRYDANEKAVQCDSELPWGQDCVMALIFNIKGTDVYAHETQVTETEIFQIIINNTTRKACFRGISMDYLSVGPQNTIVTSRIVTDDCWFNIVYKGPKVIIKTGDGKILTTQSTGQLGVGHSTADDSQEFILKLVNRPLLILKSDFGFVAFGSGTQRLDGNRPMYEASRMTSDEDGYYQFKLVSTDKYWELDKDGYITGTGEQPINFIIQLVGSNVLILKGPNGKYIITHQSGDFKATGEDAKSATMFLY